MKIFDYKAIPMKIESEEDLYIRGKVDYESYYREHLDELNNAYRPIMYSEFSVDFLREISTLKPDIDVRIIITFWFNDWKLGKPNVDITMWEWINEVRPDLLEFFKCGIQNHN